MYVLYISIIETYIQYTQMSIYLTVIPVCMTIIYNTVVIFTVAHCRILPRLSVTCELLATITHILSVPL